MLVFLQCKAPRQNYYSVCPGFRRRRNSKFEGLKPVTLCLTSLLEKEGLSKHRCDYSYNVIDLPQSN
jgi:hypothetical protein